MNAGVLQLDMLDRRVLRSNDFSQRAPAWTLGTTRLRVELQPGRSIDAVIGGAEQRANSLTKPTVKQQALTILGALRDVLRSFDLTNVPALVASEADDGSATLEWRLADRRFAFTIEENEEESAWHHVSSQRSGGLFSIGKTAHLDLRRTLALFFGQDPR